MVLYIVVFEREDDLPNEEYYYHSLSEAVNHVKLFEDDDAGIYRRIVVLNENNRTEISFFD